MNAASRNIEPWLNDALQQFRVSQIEAPARPRPVRDRKEGPNVDEWEKFCSTAPNRLHTLASAQWSADEPNWVMTLSDLTLLLLCFLALWFVGDGQHRERTTPASTTAIVGGASVATAIAAPIIEEPVSPQWNTLDAEMEKVIVESGLGRDVRLELASREFVIAMNDTVSFASGNAALRPKALPILDKLATLILGHPAALVEVSGHTDSRRISTATFPSNWELSAARASRVARYLIEKGIDPSRIAVQGYANQRPRLPDSDLNSGRANRRVEIRLYPRAETKTAAQD